MIEQKAASINAANPNFTISSVPQSHCLLEWALWYAINGLAVFPCKARDKTPLTEHGWKDATKNPNVIRAWWRKWPNANIGIACELSNIVVIDIDSPAAAKSASEQGLPTSPTVKTAKGWHVWCKTAKPMPSRVGILPGVDIRALGGYVIAPPSVHPSGGRYKWIRGRGLWAWPLPDVPEWIYELPGVKSRTDIAALAAGVPEGRRDVSLASVAGHLLRRRVEPHLAESLVYAYGRYLCDPALEDAQIAKVWNSIAGRELLRRQRRLR
ncbi:bifunctional DNA primase/polymerase [Alicyclobacillus fastidiosus]|uniref:Bifunctional DNA primase/polymerase n=1 Tax=Alicyclobacillus fastidiosus TaxID=392011 RepID=A0ABY6ZML6_9BACL|nr:bifunctional DNA primase/polymerase [Alicyclobacillus fastidiosus]WAH44065.1 bifunctional DNA primase/polymerase [Alicyclobacillus fastidiosus]GMA60352.1 hypothetical protein GCM10025859_07920 [Alicyclobacillus fastidiosus]